jgi:hypothetical protein
MRRIALLTTMAIAVLAMTVSSAFAAQARDGSGQLCPAVSPAINKANAFNAMVTPATYQSGGCTIRMSSLVTGGQSTQIVLSDNVPRHCWVKYDLHIGPDGWGYATHFTYTNGSNCIGLTSIGDRVVVPGDVAVNSGFFNTDNANTDFNLIAATRWGPTAQALAYVSLDAVASNPLKLNNQRAYNMSANWSGGSWIGDTALNLTY